MLRSGLKRKQPLEEARYDPLQRPLSAFIEINNNDKKKKKKTEETLAPPPPDFTLYDLGPMSTVLHQEITFAGIPVDEDKSGLQKEIRGEDGSEDSKGAERAVHHAVDLDLFSLIQKGRRLQTNLWNRLKIIGMEDISLASVGALILAEERFAILEAGRKRRKDANGGTEPIGLASTEEKKALIEIVYLLAKNKHARLPSHHKAVFCVPESFPVLLEEAPEIAKQLAVAQDPKSCPKPKKTFPYTGAEKADQELVDIVDCLVYCLEQRWEAGMAPLQKLLDRRTGPSPHSRSTYTVFMAFDVFRWFVEEAYPTSVVADRNAMNIMLRLFNVMTLWCRGLISNREGPPLCARTCFLAIVLADRVDWLAEPKGAPADLCADAIYELHLQRMVTISVDKRAVDMHTKRGRRAGKGKEVFALEGSVVANEDTNLVNPLYKRIYNFTKGVPMVPKSLPEEVTEAVAESEAGLFEVVCRAQLLTSRDKQDTYFATPRRAIGPFPEGRRVFVKGPFPRQAATNDPRIAMTFNELKRLLEGLSAQEMCCIDLRPDLDLDHGRKQPLGFRIKASATQLTYPFLVCADLIANAIPDGKPMPTTKHDSTLWKPTVIPDYDKLAKRRIACAARPSLLEETPDMLDRFILALSFRHIGQMPDGALRNYIWVPGASKLYSVDEDSTTLGRDENGIRDEKLLPRAAKDLEAIHRRLRNTAAREKLIATLQSWLQVLTTNETAIELLATLPAHERVLSNLKAIIDDLPSLFNLKL